MYQSDTAEFYEYFMKYQGIFDLEEGVQFGLQNGLPAFFGYFLSKIGLSEKKIEEKIQIGVEQGFTTDEITEILAKEHHHNYVSFTDKDYQEEFIFYLLNDGKKIRQLQNIVKEGKEELGRIGDRWEEMLNHLPKLSKIISMYENLDIIRIFRYFQALVKRYGRITYIKTPEPGRFSTDEMGVRQMDILQFAYGSFLFWLHFYILANANVAIDHPEQTLQGLKKALGFCDTLYLSFETAFIYVFIAHTLSILHKENSTMIIDYLNMARGAFLKEEKHLLSKSVEEEISDKEREKWFDLYNKYILRKDLYFQEM